MKRRILTEAEAEVLAGDIPDAEGFDDYDKAIRERSIRMRRHVRDALLDLREIGDRMDREDRKSVFAPPPQSDATNRGMLMAAMEAVKFAYMGVESASGNAAEIVEEGISRAENELEMEDTGHRNPADVTVDIEPKRKTLEDVTVLAERFREDPDSLTEWEATELLKAKGAAPNKFPDIDITEVAAKAG